MKQSAKNYKRIVVKIGSSIFCSEGGFEGALFDHIAGQVASLTRMKYELIVVSSGAIALGMRVLGLRSRPGDLSFLQAAASIGQNALMDNYSRAFRGDKVNCGQILLTREDFNDRKRYLNAKNTLTTLLKLGSIPVINENDTISTDEIRFGDNDRLSALVAVLCGADLLVMLSDVDGLLDKDKKVIRVIDEITPQIKALACPTDKKTCVGGMITKIEAAKIALDSGIPCVIANGRKQGMILSVLNEPGKHGTLFSPKKSLAARERWIAFGTKPKGKIRADHGACKALLEKKSLLSVGVSGVEGDFEAGDIVSVVDSQGNEIARGKSGIPGRQLQKVMGSRFDKEVIHRNNIVIL
ncbi:MAG: glutamate 5-kinase [Candidatus Omnitrophica bacterium]|nr:glutamate 5-kinase [Candidatus Omnitrophota bacterium]MDD5552640.1 glutamate 5-kinase [Candidatus Omnitrophota bacterium]